MDPSGPAQPSLDTVYSTRGNPADQTGQERSEAASNDARAHDSGLVEARERGDVAVPSTHSTGATSTSLGYGARDASGDRPNVSRRALHRRRPAARPRRKPLFPRVLHYIVHAPPPPRDRG